MKSITDFVTGITGRLVRALACAGLRGEFSLGLFSEFQGVTSPEEGRNTYPGELILARERLSTRPLAAIIPQLEFA